MISTLRSTLTEYQNHSIQRLYFETIISQKTASRMTYVQYMFDIMFSTRVQDK